VQTTNCTSKYEQKTVVEGRPPRPVMKWVLVQKICGGAIGGSNTTQPIQQQKLKKIN
jgi:hypothetical protein